jgi:NAD(P)-dependent dehydrogenase (short-subunit alcohol dehydrogenase family)
MSTTTASTHQATNPKTWLITGCSTGFGRQLATEVLAAGHRAVVTG